jgi:hypothetical protein
MVSAPKSSPCGGDFLCIIPKFKQKHQRSCKKGGRPSKKGEIPCKKNPKRIGESSYAYRKTDCFFVIVNHIMKIPMICITFVQNLQKELWRYKKN